MNTKLDTSHSRSAIIQLELKEKTQEICLHKRKRVPKERIMKKNKTKQSKAKKRIEIMLEQI